MARLNHSIEHRLWRANARAEQSMRPPYAYETKVTPLSRYGEFTWQFPADWLPAGSRNRRRLLFLERSFIDGKLIGLVVEADDLLIDQLKQVTCFLLFHLQLIDKKLTIATIHGRFTSLKKIFVAIKSAGFRSLSEINAQTFPTVRKLLPSDFNESLQLALHVLLNACMLGYVIDGIDDPSIEVENEPRNFDYSKASGKEVLGDEDYPLLVQKACVLFDDIEETERMILSVWHDKNNAPMVRDWLSQYFPGVPALRSDRIRRLAPRLLQTAGALKLSLAVGFRPNELLSTKRGFLEWDGPNLVMREDRVTFEVTKTAPDNPGTLRTFPVDPVWELGVVQRALEFIHKLYEESSERLFTAPAVDGEISTSQLGTNLGEFCRLAGLPFTATVYSVRSTLISHTAQALDGGLTQAQIAMEHASKKTTASYGLSSPFVRTEIIENWQERVRVRTVTLLEETSAMGGPGLGGEQGRRLEANMANALKSASGVITKEEVAREFWEETRRRGIFLLPVMPGVFCFKPPQAKGECAKATNDTLPDVGRCSPGCPFGVQSSYRRELVRFELSEIVPRLLDPGTSDFQRKYWTRQISDQLVAWPDLAPELRTAIANHPELLAMISNMES